MNQRQIAVTPTFDGVASLLRELDQVILEQREQDIEVSLIVAPVDVQPSTVVEVAAMKKTLHELVYLFSNALREQKIILRLAEES